MPQATRLSNGAQFLLITAAFVIVVAGMRGAAPLLVPFLLSAFFAIICAPPLLWLQRKGVPTVVALILVIAGITCIQLILLAVIGSSLNDFSEALPVYQARLQQQTRGLEAWLNGLGIPASDWADQQFDPGAIMQFAGRVFSGLSGVLSNAFLIILTVIFMLLEASSFPAKLEAVFQDSATSIGRLDTFLGNVKRYLALKTFVSLATGVLVAIWLAILGVDYPLLWGLLAFLLNYVPNIGSIIAAIPAVLLAFIQLGPGSALLTGLGYFIVNFVMGNIVEPRYLGKGLGLSTLVVFLSLVFWGWVLGPVGMLLSVPLTMMVKIALESNEDTAWLAILLGSGSEAATMVAPVPPPLPVVAVAPPPSGEGPT